MKSLELKEQVRRVRKAMRRLKKKWPFYSDPSGKTGPFYLCECDITTRGQRQLAAVARLLAEERWDFMVEYVRVNCIYGKFIYAWHVYGCPNAEACRNHRRACCSPSPWRKDSAALIPAPRKGIP